MQKTAESVSLGHPDKIADYISCYILDRMIAQDVHVKYATEVMIKDNTIVLGGEVTTSAPLGDLTDHVKAAIAEIGYDERYASVWGEYAINPAQIKVINMIGVQSSDIAQGVNQDGWGDQGVFVGYACQGEGKINRELFLARKLNKNGTGRYTYHSSIADCGITGRKLACDFYSMAAPIGGGSPWTKDASKADLTLNVYARILACENLADNDECFIYLSSCIGRAELPSGLIKTIKNGIASYRDLWCNQKPSALIKAKDKDLIQNLKKSVLL